MLIIALNLHPDRRGRPLFPMRQLAAWRLTDTDGRRTPRSRMGARWNMPDVFDRATRSRVMSRIRNRDTAPERALRGALCSAGLRGYRLHRRDIPGSPDIAWVGRRIAVFVDGAFWHGHPSAFKEGQSGAFWDEKIAHNIERDRQVDRTLNEKGWAVVRIWDFEIEQSVDDCIDKVRLALAERASAE